MKFYLMLVRICCSSVLLLEFINYYFGFGGLPLPSSIFFNPYLTVQDEGVNNLIYEDASADPSTKKLHWFAQVKEEACPHSRHVVLPK